LNPEIAATLQHGRSAENSGCRGSPGNGYVIMIYEAPILEICSQTFAY